MPGFDLELPGGGGGGAVDFDDLTDVDLTGLADGDTIVYDLGSGLWLPGPATVSIDPLVLSTTLDLTPPSTATGENAIATGHNATASGRSSIAGGGDPSNAYGFGTVGGVASGNNAFAFGTSASAAGDLGIALGAVAQADFLGCIALGALADAGAYASIAIGLQSVVANQYGMAIGGASQVLGDYGVTVGVNTVSGQFATAAGYIARALGLGASAFGYASEALGDASVAIGNARAFGDFSTAISAGRAHGVSAVVIGTGDGSSGTPDEHAIGERSVVVGYYLLPTHANHMTVGVNARADDPTVSPLERPIFSVGTGLDTADALTDRVTGFEVTINNVLTLGPHRQVPTAASRAAAITALDAITDPYVDHGSLACVVIGGSATTANVDVDYPDGSATSTETNRVISGGTAEFFKYDVAGGGWVFVF